MHLGSDEMIESLKRHVRRTQILRAVLIAVAIAAATASAVSCLHGCASMSAAVRASSEAAGAFDRADRLLGALDGAEISYLDHLGRADIETGAFEAAALRISQLSAARESLLKARDDLEAGRLADAVSQMRAAIRIMATVLESQRQWGVAIPPAVDDLLGELSRVLGKWHL